MLWVPATSAEVVIAAWPPLTGSVPSDRPVVLSLNVTVPVPEEGVMVAVMVTEVPTATGEFEEESATEEGAATVHIPVPAAL